ncbi:MAG: hypothetical protein K2W95_00800 [Candidatus Obscuribacterales bacterium]|nr:hypothetical protein [Candidatus Obscuribacterales bacterium]
MTEITQDLAKAPARQLKKFFNGAGTAIDRSTGTKALGVTAPWSLTGAEGNIDVAMGRVPKSGIVSYIHDGADQDVTIYFHSSLLQKLDATQKGWYFGAETASLHTKAVLGKALITFKGPVDAPFFLKAGTTPANNLLTNAPEHDSNPNTDLSNV